MIKSGSATLLGAPPCDALGRTTPPHGVILGPKRKKGGKKEPEYQVCGSNYKLEGNTRNRTNEMMPEETMRMWDILQDK